MQEGATTGLRRHCSHVFLDLNGTFIKCTCNVCNKDDSYNKFDSVVDDSCTTSEDQAIENLCGVEAYVDETVILLNRMDESEEHQAALALLALDKLHDATNNLLHRMMAAAERDASDVHTSDASLYGDVTMEALRVRGLYRDGALAASAPQGYLAAFVATVGERNAQAGVSQTAAPADRATSPVASTQAVGAASTQAVRRSPTYNDPLVE